MMLCPEFCCQEIRFCVCVFLRCPYFKFLCLYYANDITNDSTAAVDYLG